MESISIDALSVSTNFQVSVSMGRGSQGVTKWPFRELLKNGKKCYPSVTVIIFD